MKDVTVTCGCGRKMGLDALRGRGAFRCGCGAQVSVDIAASAACLGGFRKGQRCRFVPVQESSAFGVALCKEHLKGYRLMIETLAEGDHRQWEYLHGFRLDPRYFENTPEAKRSLRLDIARANGTMVVYYVRIGANIKIGWTTNLKQRMTAVMPEEILATEPGSDELERVRHKQFAHLHVPPGRERFRPALELLDHITMLREHYGEPRASFPVPEENVGAVGTRSGVLL